MAKVGDILLQPETGWKRYDDTDKNIKYIGTWSNATSAPDRYYNKTTIATSIIGDKCRFRFYGTKLRIIGLAEPNLSDSVNISIDGTTYNFSTGFPSVLTAQCILFEKTGLALASHEVIITNNKAKAYSMDAIDIDSTGILMDKMYVLKKVSDSVTFYSSINSTGELYHHTDLSNIISNCGAFADNVNALYTKILSSADVQPPYKIMKIDF